MPSQHSYFHIRCRGQVVRQRSAKPSLPSSNLGGTSIVVADCASSRRLFYALHQKVVSHPLRRSSSQNRNRWRWIAILFFWFDGWSIAFTWYRVEKFKSFAWIYFFISRKVLKIKFCISGFSEFDLSGTKVCKFGGIEGKILACKAITAHRWVGNAGRSKLPCGLPEGSGQEELYIYRNARLCNHRSDAGYRYPHKGTFEFA